jgi:integrase
MREWRGSVFKRAGKRHLYLAVYRHGRWRQVSTPFLPGEEAKAAQLLAQLREKILAEEAALGGGATGPVTVAAWAQRWLEKRGHSRRDDEPILRLHILPHLGGMLLADVRPRHVLDLAERWTGAARSLRNRYATLSSMFRDAAVRGLIETTPCILRRPAHLPAIEDADSEWRESARFTKAELERLISPDPAIEPDSTVTYALLGLGALRHGELAALRWRHLTPREPLPGLLVANSNRRGRTKAGRTRLMPIHPVLGAVLAEWRLSGWAALMGRAPTDDDLVLPLPLQLPAGRRVQGKRPELQVAPDARMRTKDFTWRRAARHLEALGMRHRRVHDLRRTFLSLAEADGADTSILYWGTHGRPGDILGAYRDADWRRLCEELQRLHVERRSPARARQIVPGPAADGPAEGVRRPATPVSARKQGV